MKLLTLFISLLLVATLGFNVYAQDRPSLGISPKLSEQQTVKVPYSPGILPDLLASTAYAQDGLMNVFASVPIPSGTPWTTIGSLATLSYGGAFANGNYYITTGSANQLGTVNITTGVETIIGTISGVASGYVSTGLAYKLPSGPMYLGATNISASNLYTVTLTSPVTATLIGTVTNDPGLIAMSINCAGDLYSVDIVNDDLIKINTTTGAGTIIGALGFDANYAQGAAFELSTGNYYLAAYNNTLGTAQLRQANLTTGTTTLLTTWTGREPVAFGIPGTCTSYSCDISAGPFVSLPPSFVHGTQYNMKAKITNMGSATQTSIPVKLFVNGTQVGSTQTIATLAPNAFDTNTVFPWTPASGGNAVIKIAACIGCDSNRVNDTVTTTVMVDLYNQFCDAFNSLSNWTITNNGGTCVWINEAPRSGMTMPPTSSGNIMAADVDLCGSGTTINSTATLTTALNCTNLNAVYVEMDNDFYVLGSDQAKMDVSTDGGTTWVNKFTWTASNRAFHSVTQVPEANGKPSVKFRLTCIEPSWDWWWAVDNFCVWGTITAVGNTQNNIPTTYALKQNYPNPFNPTTIITYQLPKAGNVKLVVYDLLGREVKTLVNEFKTAGSFDVTFDASTLASGVYFYRLESGSFTDTKKLTLIK
ncbi:MAG: T9SS type A sorting domain-containing protein [Ignavibacteria bacterium]